MPTWLIYILGVLTPVACVVFLAITAPVVVVLVNWASWKRQQLRARDEWGYDNPYWREAFDAGVQWAEEGRPPMRPFLGRLRLPKGLKCPDTCRCAHCGRQMR